MRIGARKKPFYRVVAIDEQAKRTGGYIELLGTYNPLTNPKDIKLKQDRIDYWIKQGAQMSVGYLRIIGKAPQKPPRKPKKEHKQLAGDSEQKKPEETKEAQDEVMPETEQAQEAVKSSEPEAVGGSKTDESAQTEQTSEEK